MDITLCVYKSHSACKKHSRACGNHTRACRNSTLRVKIILYVQNSHSSVILKVLILYFYFNFDFIKISGSMNCVINQSQNENLCNKNCQQLTRNKATTGVKCCDCKIQISIKKIHIKFQARSCASSIKKTTKNQINKENIFVLRTYIFLFLHLKSPYFLYHLKT
jgi:hypothetical protein